MVAIVSGNSLGLNLSSLALLGARGHIGSPTQGRKGDTTYVDVSSGNLVLQDLDSLLMGMGGSDVASVRTYNSQGMATFSSAAGWQWSHYKSVAAVGTGLQRTDGDGSTAFYAWDENRQAYVQTTSTGTAVDTLAVNEDGSITWTDGATGATEAYEAGGAGLIRSATDADGNTTTFSYDDAQRLIQVTDASGEAMQYTYVDGDLARISTVLGDGRTLSQVEYGYDALHRLSSVSVSLNPDGSDGAIPSQYVTTYSYDGDSARVAGLQQSDGTHWSFTYVLAAGSYRVATVTDGEDRTTQFSYDTGSEAVSPSTTVTDPLGVSAVYQYDAQGRLTQIREGVTAAHAAGLTQVAYTYTALGEVASVVDAGGRTVAMEYDANGNLTRRTDSAGDTVEWTYNASNQVQTMTVYALPAAPDMPAGQAQTTRYVYAADHATQLRFTISPQGRVTEYRYDARGLRTSTLSYGTFFYYIPAYDTTLPTEADMVYWSPVDYGNSGYVNQRQDFSYDFRGQLQSHTVFASLDMFSEGVPGTGATTHYVYDQRGALLQTVSPDGNGIVQSVYDGLGRVLSTTTHSADGTLSFATVTQYDDAHGRTTVTLGNGLSTTSSYDHAGRLVAVSQSSSANQALGITRMAYDADGRLRMTTDPTGVRAWRLYDAAGRQVADIDATGRLIEFIYDNSNQLTGTIGYHTPVDVSLLLDADGNPSDVALEFLRPTATAQDALAWNRYDDAGRLAWQVDAVGAVTHTQYDGASRVVAVTRYADAIDISADPATADLAALVTASPDDRTFRQVYDLDGLLRATVDAEGYLTEYQYDAAGLLARSIAYATAVDSFDDPAGPLANAQGADPLAGLLPFASADDIQTQYAYNSRGQLVGQVDGTGYLTETVYDDNGRVSQTVRYANAARPQWAPPPFTVARLRPESDWQDQVSTRTWDALGRLATQTNAEGTITRYAYDAIGQLVETTVAVDTDERRSVLARYDAQGRLVGQLSGNGAALITGEQTQEEIDALWSQYGTRYTYDAAGRRTSNTDALGRRTLFFYDDDSRLRFTVDAAGSVLENRYDVLGHLTQSTQYASALDASTLAGLQGGLLSATASQAAVAALAQAYAASLDHRVTQQAYDAAGRVVSTSDALGGTTALGYDAFGGLASITQALQLGHSTTTTRSFDRRGLQVEQVADADGLRAVSDTTYDAFGRVVRSVDANGHATQASYDAAGRVVTTTDATGATGRLSYDAFGRVLTQTDARGATTRTTYNTAQRSVTVGFADGTAITTIHTREGQTRSLTDANGHTTQYSYDADGNLVATATELATTTGEYDRTGQLVRSTDANGIVTTTGYDAAGRVLARTLDPEGLNLVTRYEYDALGQQIRSTDARGIVTLTRYDLNGEVLSQTLDPDGLNLRTTFSYDQAGRVLSVTDAGGTVTRHVYDDLGRRTQTVVDPDGLALTTDYAYDAVGNMVRSQSGDATTFYVYDAANRVVFSVDGLGSAVQTSYDANGNVVRTLRYANAVDLQAWQGGSAPPVVEDVARDQEVRTFYDVRNRPVYTLTKTYGYGYSYDYGYGYRYFYSQKDFAVVQREYDGNGNVIGRRAYNYGVSESVTSDWWGNDPLTPVI